MEEVCDDLVRSILVQLPAKSLLRFKNVSKTWRSLIGDLYFIDSHLKHTIETKTRDSTKLIIINDYPRQDCLFYSDVETPQNVKKLQLPTELRWNSKRHIIKSIGSCNGLILLSFSRNPNKDTHLMLMLNVSTQEYHTIQIPNLEYGREHVYYGFGYDSVNDDYKVVRIFSDGYNNEISVYNLRDDAWRAGKAQGSLQFILDDEKKGALVNGNLHWIAYCHGKPGIRSIVAFDVSSEELHEIAPLPEPEDGSTGFFSLREFQGWLTVAMICDGDFSKAPGRWVLKESGWLPLVNTDWYWMTLLMVPLAYSRTGKKILLHYDEKFVWYDMEDYEREIIYDHPYSMSATICLDTLVSISAYRRD